MATKTISLELDAYEKLRRAKRGSESFSSVVRRAVFEPEESTGAALLEETARLYREKRGVSAKTLKYWDEAAADDADERRVSSSKWER